MSDVNQTVVGFLPPKEEYLNATSIRVKYPLVKYKTL